MVIKTVYQKYIKTSARVGYALLKLIAWACICTLYKLTWAFRDVVVVGGGGVVWKSIPHGIAIAFINNVKTKSSPVMVYQPYSTVYLRGPHHAYICLRLLNKSVPFRPWECEGCRSGWYKYNRNRLLWRHTSSVGNPSPHDCVETIKGITWRWEWP